MKFSLVYLIAVLAPVATTMARNVDSVTNMNNVLHNANSFPGRNLDTADECKDLFAPETKFKLKVDNGKTYTKKTCAEIMADPYYSNCMRSIYNDKKNKIAIIKKYCVKSCGKCPTTETSSGSPSGSPSIENTEPWTESPSESWTESPSESWTESPSESWTESPSENTKASSGFPSGSPSIENTEPWTGSPTVRPTYKATKRPKQCNADWKRCTRAINQKNDHKFRFCKRFERYECSKLFKVNKLKIRIDQCNYYIEQNALN